MEKKGLKTAINGALQQFITADQEQPAITPTPTTAPAPAITPTPTTAPAPAITPTPPPFCTYVDHREPRTKRVLLTIRPSLHAAAQKIANTRGQSVNNFFEEAIQYYIDLVNGVIK